MPKIKMTVEVDEDVRDKLKALAKDDDRPMMRYIERLLEAHVSKKSTRSAATEGGRQ